MAHEYFLDWTDNVAKSAATNNTDPRVVLLPRTTNNTATPLTLYGKGAPYYGEGLQENLLRMLEHFFSPIAPPLATPGQLWFDSNENQIKVRDKDNEWSYVSGHISVLEPDMPTPGSIWYNTVNETINYYDGTDWQVLTNKTDFFSHVNNSSVHVSPAQASLLNSLSILNPTEIQQLNDIANNLNQLLVAKVNKSGDTLTGFLTLHADPVSLLHASSKQYVDNNISALRAYIDNQIFQTIQLLSGGYLGGVGTSLYVKEYEVFATSNGQTTFNIVTPSSIILNTDETLIFVQGVKQSQDELSFTNNLLTLDTPVNDNAEIQTLHFITGGGLNGGIATGGISDVAHSEIIATAGQTTITVPSYILNDNSLLLFVNGIKRTKGTHYLETNSTTITLTTPLNAGDVINVVVVRLMPTSTIKRDVFNVTSATNTFVLNTPYNFTLSTTDIFKEFAVVYVNGIKQGDSKASEINGSSIVLSQQAQPGDIVEVYVYQIAKPITQTNGDITINGSIYVKNIEITNNGPTNNTFDVSVVTSKVLSPTNTITFVGGVKQLQSAVTYNNQIVTLSDPINNGSTACVQHFILGGGLNPPSTASITAMNTADFIATAGQTVFNTPVPYSVGTNSLLVFVNGIKQVPGVGRSYVETNNTTITFNTPLSAGQIVDIVSLNVTAPGTIYRELFVNASTTNTFTLTTPYHHSTNPADVNNAAIAVYVQGIKQNGVVENNGTSITLSQSISAGKLVEIYVYKII